MPQSIINKQEAKSWVVFDSRYNTNPDRAVILGAFGDDKKAAERFAKEYPGSVIELL